MINSKQRVGCPFGGFSIPVEFLDQMLPLPKRNDGKRKRVVFTKFDAYRDMLWRACEQEQGYRAFNSCHNSGNEVENAIKKASVSVSIIVNLELQHRFKLRKTPQNLDRSLNSHTVSKLKGRGSKFVFSTLENLPVLDGCRVQAGTQRTFITCPLPLSHEII